MTGLLHRLAARANGSAWTVRSDARLPFATESLEAALPAQALQADPGPLLQPTVPSTARAVPADAAPLDRLQAAAPSTPVHPSRLQQAPWQTTAGAPTAVPGLQPTSPAPSDKDALASSPLDAMHDRPAPHQPAARPLDAVAATPREPAPLLPPHSAAAYAAMATGPAPYLPMRTWAHRAQPAAHEETEVHIHIGRIDVTAVHAPAPKARPPARERTQPVSLDAYLAARRPP